jgi:hypothetical protein
MISLCIIFLVTLFWSISSTRKTHGGGKVPLGVSRASMKKSLANKHLAGPKVAVNPRQEELEKKLQKAKKKLQQIDVPENIGEKSNVKSRKNSPQIKDEINIKEKTMEPVVESRQKVTLKELLKMKRSTRN